MNIILLLIFLILYNISSCGCIQLTSKLLNNNQDEHTILTKFARKKSNNRIWLPEYDRHINKFTEASTLDEQDAILFEYIFNNTFSSIQKTIRFTSNFIKLSTNTLAGIISGIIKSTGGICNIFANLFWIISSRLEKIIYINDEFRMRSSKAMNNTAKVLYTIGNTFIWSGEIIESMTVGLSDALVDSFKSLEFMSASSNDIVKVLLQSQHATKYHHLSSCNTSIQQYHCENEVLNLNSGDNSQSSIDRNHHHQTSKTNSLSTYSTAASNSFQELLMQQLQVDNHHINNINHADRISTDSFINNQINTNNSVNENNFFINTTYTYYTNFWSFNTSSTFRDYLLNSTLRLYTTFGIDGLIANAVYISARIMDIVFLLWEQQMNAILHSHNSSEVRSEVPSQGIFFVVSLVITFMIATLPTASIRIRIALFLLLTNILYVCFLSIENTQRARIKLHTQIQSKHDFLSYQTKQHEYSAARTDNLPATYEQSSSTQQSHSESTIWLNSILTELWEVLNKDAKTGGLGSYVNEMYADMFKTELSKVPPGVANIRLKQFNLGSNAPLLNGIHVKTERNLHCRELFDIQHKKYSGKQSKHQSKKYQSTHPDEYYYHLYSTSTNQSFLHSDNANTTEDQYSSPISSFLFNFTYFQLHQNGKLGSLANWIQQHLFDRIALNTTTSSSTRHNSSTTSEESIKTSKEKLLLHLLHQEFSSECDRLIIDIDVIYASKDMEVVLSLRSNDLQSLVPEVTVRLSELNLNGHLILNATLTDDYPFFGITQLQFRETPRLGFSLSGFGGIELSAVPYAFYWVNASIYWIIDQYTAPFSTALDLRHIICPSCDSEKPKNVIDSILQSIHTSQFLNKTILHVNNQTNKFKHVMHSIHQELQRKFPIAKLSTYFYQHLHSKSSQKKIISKQSTSSYLKAAFHVLLNSSGSIPWIPEIYSYRGIYNNRQHNNSNRQHNNSNRQHNNSNRQHNNNAYQPSYINSNKKEQSLSNHHSFQTKNHLIEQANEYITTAIVLYYQHYFIELNEIVSSIQRQITERFVPNL